MTARIPLLSLCIVLLSACSLTYTEEEPEVSHIPELVFSDAEYLSYEDGRMTMRLATQRLEQYQEDDSFYAAHVSFETYTEEGELSAEGFCQMISANPDDERYTLLGDVSVDSVEEDLLLRARSVQWDGRKEQLVASATDAIELVRGRRRWEGDAGDAEAAPASDGQAAEGAEGEAQSRIELTGTGFSASAVSRSFEFDGEVSGVIYTRKGQGAAR